MRWRARRIYALVSSSRPCWERAPDSFAATSATYGMPMVVELGIALDVLVGMVILGVFLFQIRERFDSLDIHHLEKLRED